MSTQWHPLFARLLGVLLQDYYEIQTEVPVSELPRRGDILLIRRQTGQKPPFQGLWSRLTEWSLLEFKGPTDRAEEDDLELLVHVGTGLTYRFNQERRTRGEERLANSQVSFWYLVPKLGDTFLGHARTRSHFEYETGGLWRGSVWGHPVWLVAYNDLLIEEDSIPLHLFDQPSAPRSLVELVSGRQELIVRYAEWLNSLQPAIWKEILKMASTTMTKTVIDWKKVVECSTPMGLMSTIQTLAREDIFEPILFPGLVEAVGLPRLIEILGLKRVVELVGQERVLETVAQAQLTEPDMVPDLIEVFGVEKVLPALRTQLPRLIKSLG